MSLNGNQIFFAGIVIYELHLSAADIHFRYIYTAQCEAN